MVTIAVCKLQHLKFKVSFEWISQSKEFLAKSKNLAIHLGGGICAPSLKEDLWNESKTIYYYCAIEINRTTFYKYYKDNFYILKKLIE